MEAESAAIAARSQQELSEAQFVADVRARRHLDAKADTEQAFHHLLASTAAHEASLNVERQARAVSVAGDITRAVFHAKTGKFITPVMEGYRTNRDLAETKRSAAEELAACEEKSVVETAKYEKFNAAKLGAEKVRTSSGSSSDTEADALASVHERSLALLCSGSVVILSPSSLAPKRQQPLFH